MYFDNVAHSVAAYGNDFENFLKEINRNNCIYSFMDKKEETDFAYFKMRIEFELKSKRNMLRQLVRRLLFK